jgi:hypothetical protein
MMGSTKLHASAGLSIIITFPSSLAGMMKEIKTPGFVALNCRQGMHWASAVSSPITIIWWKKWTSRINDWFNGCFRSNRFLRRGIGDVTFILFSPSFPW